MRTAAALSSSCRLRDDKSISNRSSIVWASGTLDPITSNSAARHYSEDRMSLRNGDILFISLVSGACICSL